MGPQDPSHLSDTLKHQQKIPGTPRHQCIISPWYKGEKGGWCHKLSHVQCTIVHTQTHQHVKVEQYSSNRGNYPSALKYLAGNQDKVTYSFFETSAHWGETCAQDNFRWGRQWQQHSLLRIKIIISAVWQQVGNNAYIFGGIYFKRYLIFGGIYFKRYLQRIYQ